MINNKITLLVILALFAVMRLVYIGYGPFDLSPDEAHYWEWSRRLDLSYYSKGPAVAYVIAFFTGIFGDTALGVRLGAVLFSTASSWMLYLLGRDMFKSEKAGFYGAIFANVIPIFAVGAVLMTTDVVFIFFWITAVYCLMKALQRRDGLFWYLAGISIGLGFMGKYTTLLIYPCLLLYMLFSYKDRFWLRRRPPYIAGLLSLLVVTPVIYWNISHGQVTIRHTLGHAHASDAAYSIMTALEFVASQVLLITPIVFVGLVWGVARCFTDGFRYRESALKLAFFTTAPLFLFFLVASVRGKVQGNWAIASYVVALPSAVWAIETAARAHSRKERGLVRGIAAIGVIIALLATILVYLPMPLEWAGAGRFLKGPPFNRVMGWKELGLRVGRVKSEMEKHGDVFVMSDTYQIASELAFYTPGNPVTYNADTGTRRMNQYDLWPGYEGLKGYNAVYVKGGASEIDSSVADTFESCAKETFFIYRGMSALKEFSIFRCYGFKGAKKSGFERF
ncbi:MAG: glycosyltransferase family 39 protein [Deltaproteobacteria bacterium]|nr:glycosyltransferase family 39 protein [Deltaproteobacteria bacterium]